MILIGVGILLPFVIQFAIVGMVTGTVNPMALGRDSTGPVVATGLVTTISYFLQTSAFFACWRLALHERETVGRALGFGLVSGLVAILLIVLLAAVAVGAGQTAPAGLAFPAVMILAIPLAIALAALYSVATAAIAVGLSLMLVLAMIGGAATGQIGLAATMVGGNGFVAVLYLILAFICLWLAARLSCTTTLMADGRSLNFLAAVRESWGLTWEEQWSIMRYLALIGLGIAILFVALAFAIGAFAMATTRAGAGIPVSAGPPIVTLIVGIPILYLSVMVTVGIYRELNPAIVNAEVFA